MSDLDDAGPYCECGHCDATGRGGGRPVVLPADAWRVAGGGDPRRIAVAPSHARHYPGLPLELHDGWVAVGPDPEAGG